MLLPVGYVDEPFRIDRSYVPGVKPSLTVDHLSGRLRVVPVPLHDIRTARQYLPVLRNPDLDVPDRVADAPEPVIVKTVDRNDGRTLRKPVALDNAETDRLEKLPELLPQSRAPGTEKPHPSPGFALHSGKHQAVGKGVPEMKPGGDFPFSGPGGIFPADPHGPVE